MADDFEPNPRASLGGNQPPSFEQQMEEENAALTDEMAELELELRRLPGNPQSDADVAVINDWVTRRRDLAKRLEAKRVVVKAPALERCTAIDGWFGAIRRQLLEKAADVEKRSGPYLLARQKAEEERRRAEAAEAKRKADELKAAADKAQRELEEQRRLQQEQEDRLRKEEQERQARIQQAAAEAAKQAQDLAAATNTPQPVPPPAPPVSEAQGAYQQATMDLGAASKAADKAAEEARKAETLASRAEKKADAGGGGKVQGGGANAKAEMVWVGKVKSWPSVIQSLGPLGQFFTEQVIQDAVDRAAKVKDRPTVPGVEFSQELAVKTTATRKGA
jgi:DNA repair exonuclease SbcCD ATPase subunit